jgi:DNA-binding response OmpR family regulator
MNKILIINENEKDYIDICSKTNAKFECFHATDEHEALELLENEDFSCILLDCDLETISGMDLFLKLKSSSSVPIVVMTGRGSEEMAKKFFKNGALDYLIKNFDSKQLLTALLDAKKISGYIKELKEIRGNIALRLSNI